MKRTEIVIGQCYIAKVSGKLVPVRIMQDNGDGTGFRGRARHNGFTATNTATGRRITITAARLRRPTGTTERLADKADIQQAEQCSCGRGPANVKVKYADDSGISSMEVCARCADQSGM